MSRDTGGATGTRADTIRGWLFTVAAACAPLEMALVTTSFTLLAAASIALARPASLARSLRANPASLASLALFGWIGLRCFGSEASTRDALGSWLSYHELALLPLFVAAPLSGVWRKRAISAFVAGNLLAAAVSYGRLAGLIEALPPPLSFEPPRGSIGGGWMLALAAFFCVLRMRPGTVRERRCLAGAVAVMLGVVVFLIAGRTAWLSVIVLAAVALAGARRRRVVQALAALVLAAVAAWFISPYMSQRLSEGIARTPEALRTNSTAIRMEFYRLTARIVAQAPLLGHGTGSFPGAYDAMVRSTGSAAPATRNPHSQYLLIAAESGIVGVALFLALLVVMWRHGARLGSFDAAMLRGVTLTMAVSCLFNSFLFDGPEARAFVLLASLGLMARGAATARSVEP